MPELRPLVPPFVGNYSEGDSSESSQDCDPECDNSDGDEPSEKEDLTLKASRSNLSLGKKVNSHPREAGRYTEEEEEAMVSDIY